jgi:hypothetical protein
MDAGKLDEARQALTQAAMQAPADPSPHLLLSQIYSSQKDFDRSTQERRIFQSLKDKASTEASSTRQATAPGVAK